MKLRCMLVLATAVAVANIYAEEFSLIDLFRPYLSTNYVKHKGTHFKGQLVKNKKQGIGLMEMKNGDIYIGDFSDNNMHGTGILIHKAEPEECPGSCVFVGRWKNNLRQGKGICYNEFGGVLYSGPFKDNIPVSEYPSIPDSISAEKQFLVIDLPEQAKLVGQFVDGDAHGLGVFLFANGDLIISPFRDGEQKGIGLYLYQDGDWETILCEDGDFTSISSSAEYKAASAAQRQSLMAGLSDAMNSLAAATSISATMVGMVGDMKNPTASGVSLDEDYAGNETDGGVAGGRKSGSTAGSGAKYDMSKQNAYNSDKRTYAKYDSMLSAAFAGNRKATESEISNWQNKMRSLREKWESQGKSFPKSSNESK